MDRYRPAPTVEDLALTAEGMVQRAELKGYLQAIAKAFSEVYETQALQDFWGMREFYSTVRAVNKALSEHETLSPVLFVSFTNVLVLDLDTTLLIVYLFD